mmetsp:Transcript_103439/g.316627  ORF Transcript_103439/g.316627 Transcript_103439/m.316627 type:complete len:204 (+) Transcript_103439:416-1027(+)
MTSVQAGAKQRRGAQRSARQIGARSSTQRSQHSGHAACPQPSWINTSARRDKHIAQRSKIAIATPPGTSLVKRSVSSRWNCGSCCMRWKATVSEKRATRSVVTVHGSGCRQCGTTQGTAHTSGRPPSASHVSTWRAQQLTQALCSHGGLASNAATGSPQTPHRWSRTTRQRARAAKFLSFATCSTRSHSTTGSVATPVSWASP